MTIRSIATALGVAMLLLQSGPVSAQQAKCLAGKTKCMSKKGTGLIKCEQLAETPGKPADPDANGCRTKVVGKYDGGVDPTKGCFEKLENKSPNDCISFDDTGSTEAAIDNCVAEFVEAIDPAPITQTKCGAGKKKCVSKYFKARMKCNQLAQTPGKPADPNANACVDKAVAKYTGGIDPTKGCFAKLEAKNPNDCQFTNDSPTLQGLVEDCVDDLVNAVANPPTTTTSSSSTSSSSSSTAAPTTSSSSTVAPTTSSSSTATPTTTSSTSTTIGAGPSGFDFTSTTGTGTCGTTFRDLAATIPLKNLGCGQLSLGGGISQVPDNATPPGAINRFTLSCTGPNCNLGTTASGSTPAGVDCTAAGCKFGTPLPIVNAGLSVCVTNTFFPNARCLGAASPFACCTGAGTGTCSGPTGTLNTTTGAASWIFELNSATILTGNPAQPCPICAVSVGGAACSGTLASPCTGVCDGSPNQGAACQSKNSVGVSSDCPAPAAVAGAGGQRCFRGSNNNGVCSTGADCPGGLCAAFIGNIPIALSPLTTGTSSLTSPFDNNLCTGAGAPNACCTGSGTGNCNLFCPGQTSTQKGAFGSSICLGGTNNGKPCTTVADCPGSGTPTPTCRAATLTNYCVGGANNGLGCSSATNCPAPGTCVRAGTVAQVVREVGTPAGALTIGVPKAIKLGSAFCVAATTNPTVNANANLPGPGGTDVTGTVTLLP